MSAPGANRLYQGDNLELLGTLATGSIDAVAGDPPYNVNLNPQTCAWDVWPSPACWSELYRVVKPDGLMAFLIAPHVAHARVPDVIAAGAEIEYWQVYVR